MKAFITAVCVLVVVSCKKDKDDDVPVIPSTVSYTAKIDGSNYVGANGRARVDSANATIKIARHMKLISNLGPDKGMLLAIELTDNKLKTGKYSLTPRSNGTLPAYLFYSENLDQAQSTNYASYYVKKEDQKGEINITVVNDTAIVATFHGTVLTAFGQVQNPTKQVTEGKLYIKL